MKHYNETSAFTSTGQPNFTQPLDPLNASRLKPQTRPGALDLEDLLHSLRGTLMTSRVEGETMLAAQMHLMNAAFNRLIMAATNTEAADPYAIEVAIRAQRRCERTLDALEGRMEKILGKQSDHRPALDRPDPKPRRRADDDDWLKGGGA